MVEWLKAFADDRKLSYSQDKAGNLVIRRAGSGGGEKAPVVVIQGHIDMVCEKRVDSKHDFTKDPIQLRVESGWLRAKDTTLGADNGIGVAAALAVLDLPSTAKLPPLECLFTVDEETGLTGAKQLDGSMLRGKTMLNLDTEEFGAVYMGCSGGGDSVLTLPVSRGERTGADCAYFDVTVAGLRGGHSGGDIHLGGGNAVRIVADVVQALRSELGSSNVRALDLSGGDKRNAIPRNARARLVIPRTRSDAARKVFSARVEATRAQYKGEKKFCMTFEEGKADAEGTAAPLSDETADALLSLLDALPHGVIKMSADVEDLVETSSNLASARLTCNAQGKEEVEIICLSRSCVSVALDDVRKQIAATAKKYGAAVKQPATYPGWKPDLKSRVLALTKSCYKEMLGSEPEQLAIHAGLECGIIGERCAGMDMVSFGPTIRGAHSPDEACEIATVAPFFKLVLAILGRLADVPATK